MKEGKREGSGRKEQEKNSQDTKKTCNTRDKQRAKKRMTGWKHMSIRERQEWIKKIRNKKRKNRRVKKDDQTKRKRIHQNRK